MSVRFTAWFSEKEREEIHNAAKALGSSDNYVVRMAVRQFLGSSPQLSRLLHVTSETPDTQARAERQ